MSTTSGGEPDSADELLSPTRSTGRYPGYAGDSLLRYDRYACPDCRRAWVVLDADEDEQPPERCPDDGSVLMFVSGA